MMCRGTRNGCRLPCVLVVPVANIPTSAVTKIHNLPAHGTLVTPPRAEMVDQVAPQRPAVLISPPPTIRLPATPFSTVTCHPP